MTTPRRMKWRDFRFQFFDRNPQVFDAFEGSLDELQTMVFDFSERKKYDLTRHALSELQSLISAYLLARDNSLRIPTGTMALLFPSETGFDPVLTRQLERFKAHAARGISASDQEFVKQVAAVLANLSIASLRSRSYFPEHGANSVTTFVSAYLSGAIRDAAMRGLDDVAMEGADHLRDLCKALLEERLYIGAITQIADLEQLATISILRASDVVLCVVVRSLSDCLLHNFVVGHPGTHITSHLLQGLIRIVKARLASPLGLEGMTVNYSVGPFISPTERSSFAAISVAVANGIVQLSRSDERESLSRLRSLYRELHDRAWLDFAELGIEAVKKNSFLLHFVNSTVEETVRANFRLVQALDLPRIEEDGWEAAREQHGRDRFRDEVRKEIRWETTGVYSRIIPAMFEHQQIHYLDDTIELQSLFAFWAVRIGMEDVALEAVERIFSACTKLRDPRYNDVYASSRLAIHVAQIGAYAIAFGAEKTLRTAAERYRTLWESFREQYSDLNFVGDFESAESELLGEGARPSMIDPVETEFFSTVTPEQIRAFFAAL